MADYHSLIARAVEGLGNNTAGDRRTFYERVRATLVMQLQGIDPPPSEAEITSERLALEDAIRQVEAESVRKARAEPRSLKMFRKPIAAADDLDVAPPQTAAPSRDAHNDYRGVQPPEFSDGHELTWEHAEPADYEQSPDLLEDGRPLESDGHHRGPRAPHSYRGLAQLVTAAAILLGVGTVVYWQWSNLNGVYQFLSLMRSGQNQTTQQPADEPKFTTAQRVVLYEEDSGNPQGKQYAGSARWRAQTVSPGSGLAPELQIRADLSIPDRNMTVAWSLRRNTDQVLPASHTIEIIFNLPPNFAGGGVANVPAIRMKDSEQDRGMPLAGVTAKVTNGFFLIGLSAIEADVQQNMQLLKERPWLGIAIVYNNGERAILKIEKGPSGDRAFADAFAAWGN
jgi:hypothetical protein